MRRQERQVDRPSTSAWKAFVSASVAPASRKYGYDKDKDWRKNPTVFEDDSARVLRLATVIPKGFRKVAQGCRAAATLGNGPQRPSTPKELRSGNAALRTHSELTGWARLVTDASHSWSHTNPKRKQGQRRECPLL